MPQVNFAEKLKEQEEPEKVDFASRLGGFNRSPSVPEAPDERETIQSILGADLDTENFAPASLRISLSRGDNLKEKNLRLQKEFPA